jgi:hypothetical protein
MQSKIIMTSTLDQWPGVELRETRRRIRKTLIKRFVEGSNADDIVADGEFEKVNGRSDVEFLHDMGFV